MKQSYDSNQQLSNQVRAICVMVKDISIRRNLPPQRLLTNYCHDRQHQSGRAIKKFLRANTVDIP